MHRGWQWHGALLISLMAIGVRPDDEVIATPFTFVATAEVIVLLGAVIEDAALILPVRV
jgi:hypothetical protein